MTTLTTKCSHVSSLCWHQLLKRAHIIQFIGNMVIHVNIEPDIEKGSKSKIHLLPCLIRSNTDANVTKYFEPIITKCENDVMTASFRGYPLIGKEVALPGGYCGVVLQEAQEKLNEEGDRNLYVAHKFDKFTYWNWDRVPTQEDKLIAALEWVEISKALHSPIDS